ncbi:50S ribosomal protein L25 [Candidatus Gottesmanbacteria bacterium]|nr:50S ribosomal protein L25 [Candidatus Gottesmanbacteria bacterium]
MKKYTLTAKERTLVGRKVKNLRKEGNLPASLYGKHIKSQSLAVSEELFTEVYDKAGETGLIELKVGSEVKPVLVHTVQIDPVSDAILHVEFYQVNLKEKVKAKVPVVQTGVSPAMTEKLGVLLTLLDEIEVEALPTDLPEKIEVDVSTLARVDQEIRVSDLKVPSEVTILSDGEQGVVKVGALVTREAQAEAEAEEAAKAAAQATVEGAEAPATEGAPSAAEVKKEEIPESK